MSYTRSVPCNFGAGKAGLTDLRAQLYDVTGADSGAAIATGFTDKGGGVYSWIYAGFADGFRGGVLFYSNAAPTVRLGVDEINPEQHENPDVKTSTRSSHTAADVWAAGTRTLTSFGTLVTDTTTAVWAAGTRTLTSFGTLATDVTTLLARVGAFTGTGLNTVLGFLKALGSKEAALTPSDMGGTFDNTTDSEEAIRDALTAGTLTAAGVWSYTSRTLTQSAVQVAAILSGDKITVLRGDTITLAFTNLGSMTGNTKLWLTVKNIRPGLSDAADTGAVLQVERTVGLVRINGAAGTASDGSIVVNAAATGDITVTVAPAASALLVPDIYSYDVQSLIAGVVHTHTQGRFLVVRDDTRAVS